MLIQSFKQTFIQFTHHILLLYINIHKYNKNTNVISYNYCTYNMDSCTHSVIIMLSICICYILLLYDDGREWKRKDIHKKSNFS